MLRLCVFIIFCSFLSGCLFRPNIITLKIKTPEVVVTLENKVYELHAIPRMPDSEMTNTFERFNVPHFSGDGSRLFVGAQTEWHSSRSEPGSVFVFDYDENLDEWSYSGLIRHPAPVSYHKMGSAIVSSHDGKTVFTAGEFTRAVLVFKESGGVWTLDQTISLAVPFEFFGMSLKLSQDGRTLLIGSLKNVETITDQGAVYIYKLNSVSGQYEYFQKLTDIDALSTTTYYGTTISTDKNFETIAISSHRETITHTQQGRVYIYKKNRSTGFYERSQALEKVATHNSLTFGRHLQLSNSGKILAVAHAIQANTFVEGGVSIYRRGANGQYIFSQEISAPADIVNPTGNTSWALRVNFNSDESQLLVTGSSCYIDQVAAKGCFDVYKNTGTTFTHYKRFSPRGATSSSFGSTAEFSSDSKFFAVGAPNQALRKGGSGTAYSASGSVYVYKARDYTDPNVAEAIIPNRYLPLRKDDLMVYSTLDDLLIEEIWPGLTELFTNVTVVNFSGGDVSSLANNSSIKIDGTNFSGPITVGFSYYATAATNGAVLCSNDQFEVRIANTSQLEIRYFNAGRVTATAWMTDPSTFQLNQWNNYLISLDWDITKEPKVYVNGDKVFLYHTTVASPTLAPMPSTFSVGSYNNSNTHAGQIKNLLIWEGTMSPAEAFLFKYFY